MTRKAKRTVSRIEARRVLSWPERRRAGSWAWRSGVVTVVQFFFGFFFVLVEHAVQLQRSDGHDLEVGAALGTGDDLALVDFVFLDVEIALALGTKHHNASEL